MVGKWLEGFLQALVVMDIVNTRKPSPDPKLLIPKTQRHKMLTVKVYRQGTTTLLQLVDVVIVDPDAQLWETVLQNFTKNSKENLDDHTPYKIVIGTDAAGVDIYIGLFGSDTCYVTTGEGRTIEAIRPAKPEPTQQWDAVADPTIAVDTHPELEPAVLLNTPTNSPISEFENAVERMDPIKRISQLPLDPEDRG